MEDIDFIKTITTIIHPLSGILLLPITVLWVEVGEKSIIFILLHFSYLIVNFEFLPGILLSFTNVV